MSVFYIALVISKNSIIKHSSQKIIIVICPKLIQNPNFTIILYTFVSFTQKLNIMRKTDGHRSTFEIITFI